MKNDLTYEFLKNNGLILFETIVGSQAYGTNTPESDIDKKFVYIQPQEHIYGYKYQEQLIVNDDFTGFELKRFLELVHLNNPNIFELLNSPSDCIIYKDPLFDLILDKKSEFISKICKNSFGGYAKSQISKAVGMNKKQNWEKEKMTRKSILDFCYIINGHKSIPLKKLLLENNLDQTLCGVSKIPNARDMFAIFYDNDNKFKYKGIIKTGHGDSKSESNQLRLSSIPKGETPFYIFSYNKDGYTTHCKDYKEYEKWLKNRNTQRWVETKSHGQQIDGKNMLHCKRLIQMSIEIGEGKGIIVRRSDAAELLKIRKGEIPLEELIKWSREAINKMDVLFDKSDLPDSVDKKIIDDLLINIRRQFYSR